MRKKILLIVIAAFTGLNHLSAQVNFGFGGSIISPQGDFGKNVGTSPGIGIDASFRFKKLHLETGLSSALTKYYSASEQVAYSSPKYQHSIADRERNNVLNVYNLFVRAYPLKDKAFQPYVDARIGITRLATKEIYTDPFRNQNVNTSNCESPAVLNMVTILKDNALNYGGGIGLQTDLLKILKYDPAVGTLIFDVNVLYLRGDMATYKNMHNTANPHDLRGNYTSGTDMLMVNFGFKLSFFTRDRNTTY